MGSVSLIEKVQWVIRHEGVPALFEKVWRRVKDPSLLKKPVEYDWTKWVPGSAQLMEMESASAALAYKPVISVILPVYNPPEQFLRDALQSVCDQMYPHWELCVADDCSTEPHVKRILSEYEQKDSRVKVCYREQNGHISASSNSALEIATGEFVALLDHDDVLAPHALFVMARELNEDRSLDLIYSDEDKIDKDGQHSAPGLKSAWSPDYFLSFMYIGHLSLYRRAVVEEAGAFRQGYEGSQDYDLALRVTELTHRIKHVPEMLYYWRMHGDSVAGNIHAKPYAFEAAKKALGDAYDRRGVSNALVVEGDHPGVYRLTTTFVDGSNAALCLWCDSKERAETLAKNPELALLKGLRLIVGYPISDESSVYESDASTLFVQVKSAETQRYDFLRLCLENLQVENVIVIDCTNCIPDNEAAVEILRHLCRSGVGMVGSKLLTPAHDIVHVGYTVEEARVSHTLYGAHRLDHGYGARAVALSNVSAVSSICFGVKRAVLESALSGDGQFRNGVAFDVALSQRVSEAGLRILMNPYAKAVLRGDMPARVTDLSKCPEDLELLQSQYNFIVDADPYYPKGLDREELNFQLTEQGYGYDC